jgi:hypothetical protein
MSLALITRVLLAAWCSGRLEAASAMHVSEPVLHATVALNHGRGRAQRRRAGIVGVASGSGTLHRSSRVHMIIHNDVIGLRSAQHEHLECPLDGGHQLLQGPYYAEIVPSALHGRQQAVKFEGQRMRAPQQGSFGCVLWYTEWLNSRL